MYVDLLKAIEDYSILKISRKQFYNLMGENPGFYIKNKGKISSAETLRQQLIKERNLEVIYISGGSGSGKTVAAKYFADKLKFDYFISGSGEDILDGYGKEECIILDDFRGSTFRFSELLKFLDNNTNSTIKSRYNNKDISNCRLIIITSVEKPQKLYSVLTEKEESNSEPAEQLYRRLKHHYWVIEGEPHKGSINEVLLSKTGEETRSGRTLGNMENIYKELGINPEKTDTSSILDVFVQETIDKPKLTEVTDIDEINLIDQIF